LAIAARLPSLFTPTIIAALGKWTTPQSLLLSTPPYVFAFITTMITAYLSDRTGRRAVFLWFWFIVAAVGYIMFLTVPLSNPVSLFGHNRPAHTPNSARCADCPAWLGFYRELYTQRFSCR
jgi:MFS family permease